jgi:hypothetical protein
MACVQGEGDKWSGSIGPRRTLEPHRIGFGEMIALRHQIADGTHEAIVVRLAILFFQILSLGKANVSE